MMLESIGNTLLDEAGAPRQVLISKSRGTKFQVVQLCLKETATGFGYNPRDPKNKLLPFFCLLTRLCPLPAPHNRKVNHSKSLESTMGIIRLILGKLILLFNWLFTAREELLTGGGDLKVHCLRISDGERGYQWMYESSDIVRYLEERFIAPSGIAAA